MATAYYVNTKDGSAIDWEPSFQHYPEGEWRKVTKAEYERALRDNARADLRKQLKPGATVYTVLRRQSASGMMRHISLVVAGDGGKVEDITWQVARALERTMDRDTGGIREGGGGMDMGFHLVYALGRALYPDGFGIEGDNGFTKRRPGNAKRAEQMRAQGFKFRGRNGDGSGWDNDGGYALEHRWL